MVNKILNLSRRWKILMLVIISLNIVVLFITLYFIEYRRLLYLFYYSFFSNSPVSWVVPVMPQEPILLIYGNFFNPWLVALTAGAATFIIELFNYQMLVPVCNLKQLEPFKSKRSYKVLSGYFNKIPFAVITFVGFTPVPHLPFRILSVLTGYPIVKYAVASFTGRISFYFLVAQAGTILKLPYWVYIILLVSMFAFAMTANIVRLHKKNRIKKTGG